MFFWKTEKKSSQKCFLTPFFCHCSEYSYSSLWCSSAWNSILNPSKFIWPFLISKAVSIHSASDMHCDFLQISFMNSRQVCSTAYLTYSLGNLMAISNPAWLTLESWSYPQTDFTCRFLCLSWCNSMPQVSQAKLLEVTLDFFFSHGKLFL